MLWNTGLMQISASNAMIAAQTAAQSKPLRLPELSSHKAPQAEAARPSANAAAQPNQPARPGSQLNILI
jgi:hypothetical protein